MVVLGSIIWPVCLLLWCHLVAIVIVLLLVTVISVNFISIILVRLLLIVVRLLLDGLRVVLPIVVLLSSRWNTTIRKVIVVVRVPGDRWRRLRCRHNLLSADVLRRRNLQVDLLLHLHTDDLVARLSCVSSLVGGSALIILLCWLLNFVLILSCCELDASQCRWHNHW